MSYRIKKAVNIISDRGLFPFFKSLTRYVYSKLKYRAKSIKYEPFLPEPSKIIHIKTSNVKYKLKPFFWRELNTHFTHIRDGDWDINRFSDIKNPREHNTQDVPRHLYRIENWNFYDSMKKRFNDGRPWEETSYYEKINESMNEKNIKKHLQKVDDLYADMKKNGYKKQKDLQNSGEKAIHPWRNEVAINIGRDGTMVLDDGRHRLCLSKILGINKIPVRIFVRHKKWMNVYKNIHNSTSMCQLTDESKNHLEHPDIVKLAEQKGFI